MDPWLLHRMGFGCWSARRQSPSRRPCKLPKTILMYPMTLASQAAHIVMRFQQNVAELAIKGDSTLEIALPAQGRAAGVGDVRRGPDRRDRRGLRAVPDGGDGERRTEGRFALYSVADAARSRQRPDRSPAGNRRSRRPTPRFRPTWSTELDYESLTLAQLRARLQSLRCRRTRSAAGLRAGHQGPRTVPDAARQQDHPREREVTPAGTSEPNSAENPFPVRAVAIRVAGWIDKLGTVWVEGQLAQINDAAGLQDRVHGAA